MSIHLPVGLFQYLLKEITMVNYIFFWRQIIILTIFCHFEGSVTFPFVPLFTQSESGVETLMETKFSQHDGKKQD